VETMELLSGNTCISSVKSTTQESQVPPSLPLHVLDCYYCMWRFPNFLIIFVLSKVVTSTPGPWTRSARHRLLSESSPVTPAKSSSSRCVYKMGETK
jgi:hypothetical protein